MRPSVSCDGRARSPEQGAPRPPYAARAAIGAGCPRHGVTLATRISLLPKVAIGAECTASAWYACAPTRTPPCCGAPARYLRWGGGPARGCRTGTPVRRGAAHYVGGRGAGSGAAMLRCEVRDAVYLQALSW